MSDHHDQEELVISDITELEVPFALQFRNALLCRWLIERLDLDNYQATNFVDDVMDEVTDLSHDDILLNTLVSKVQHVDDTISRKDIRHLMTKADLVISNELSIHDEETSVYIN